MMLQMGYLLDNLPGSDSPKTSTRKGRKAMCSRVMESRACCKVRVKMMPTYYSDTDLRVSSSEKAYNLRSVKAAEKVSTVNSQHPHTGRPYTHYLYIINTPRARNAFLSVGTTA